MDIMRAHQKCGIELREDMWVRVEGEKWRGVYKNIRVEGGHGREGRERRGGEEMKGGKLRGYSSSGKYSAPKL